MDIQDAIRKRKSIRGFKPDPVPREVIESLLETAIYAPSAMNSQPWEFFVLAGQALDKVREANIENLRSGVAGQPDHMAAQWSKDTIFRERQVALAKQLFALMGIEREDKEKRMQWLERGFRFFDAPVAVIIASDASLGEAGPLLDIGAAMQNICLAALPFGLGTCIEDQGVFYPEVIRQHAQIDEHKRIVVAIAIGYPDPDFPANRVETTRVPVSENTTWFGFNQ